MKEKLLLFGLIFGGWAVFYFSHFEPFQKEVLCSLWVITVLLIQVSATLSRQLVVMETPDEPEVQFTVTE